MTKKNKIEAVKTVKTVDETALCDFETALLTALKVGAIQAQAVNELIEKAGFNVADEEHAACKPISAKEQAALALASFGVDIASLKPAQAKAGKLAVNYDTLAKALGKLECHIDKPLHDNGTSLVTHHIAQGLLNGQKRFSIGEIIAKVNETYTMPKGVPYASTGHINTIKALLKKAGFNLQSPSGFFIVS